MLKYMGSLECTLHLRRFHVSVDDQLFRQDGTLLTGIDISVLKFAGFVASFFFAEEEDETFERAISWMQRVGGALIILSALLYGTTGDYFDLVLLGILGAIKFRQSFTLTRCEGKGTNVGRFRKVLGLFFLSMPFTTGPLVFLDVLASGWTLLAISYWLLAIGFVTVILGDHYVSRLGARPPRKKKERVPAPVLNPQ